MTKVYVGVGSNVGDRSGNVDLARFYLEKKGIQVKRTSPLYETEAICKGGGSGEKSAQPSPAQTMPKFLNGVFEIETDLLPEALREELEHVERLCGRNRKGDWQSRTMDLDILIYGDKVFDSQRLKVPHPAIEKRWFVLKPLADLAPDLVHPILKTTIKEILCNFSSIPPT